MKKYAICIPSSDDFALPTAVLIYSLEKNFKAYEDCDIIVPYNTLTEVGMSIIRKAAPNVIFKKPKDSSFYEIIPGTFYGKDNYDVYLSFEAFSQEGYEKTIYMDADMLCIKDFSDALKYPHDVTWRNPNLGILIADKKCVPSAYYKLIDLVKRDSKIRNDSGGDQKAVRHMYGRESKKVKFISELYNFQSWGGGGKGSNKNFLKYKDQIKVIHYSGSRKPWGNVWDGTRYDKNSIKYPYLMFHCEAVKIWHEYYEDFKNYRIGETLSPFEKYEIQNNVFLKDTPGSVDGLSKIEEQYLCKRGDK
tara:strand:+ start:5499 stop:6413 length:915 start_codon:yes stop_codon:yes gene_type:complete